MHIPKTARGLEAATTATTLPAGAIRRNGGHVLNTANLHAGTSEGTESSLGAGSRGLGANTTGGPDLDVQGGDAELLAADSHVLGGKHSSVGGRLIPVSLHLHTSGDTDKGLTTSQISDVDEGVVEGSKDVSDGENLRSCTVKMSETRTHLCFHETVVLVSAGP